MPSPLKPQFRLPQAERDPRPADERRPSEQTFAAYYDLVMAEGWGPDVAHAEVEYKRKHPGFFQ